MNKKRKKNLTEANKDVRYLELSEQVLKDIIRTSIWTQHNFQEDEFIEDIQLRTNKNGGFDVIYIVSKEE